MTPQKRKKRKRAQRAGLHSQSQRAGRRSWLKARNVAVGLTALLLVVMGAGAILLGPGHDSGSGRTPEVDLDKSMGAADAPVTVVEYGDFQ